MLKIPKNPSESQRRCLWEASGLIKTERLPAGWTLWTHLKDSLIISEESRIILKQKGRADKEFYFQPVQFWKHLERIFWNLGGEGGGGGGRGGGGGGGRRREKPVFMSTARRIAASIAITGIRLRKHCTMKTWMWRRFGIVRRCLDSRQLSALIVPTLSRNPINFATENNCEHRMAILWVKDWVFRLFGHDCAMLPIRGCS